VNVQLRPMQPEDVAPLVDITARTGFFRPDEVAVAEELLADCAAKGDKSEYCTWVAEDESGLKGYVCFGATPMTRGTWDVYWIAVDPGCQGRGIGKKLMELAENEIRKKQGRLVLVETSSQELYEPTRQFYTRLDYQIVSRIADFYDIGDDRLIYAKSLTSGGGTAMPI